MQPLNALETDKTDFSLGTNYLLLGTDVFLADMVTASIRTKLSSKHSIDLVIIYGDDVKAAQLNDLLDAYSIFSSEKLVLIKNAEALAKKELDSLATYFSNPSENQSVVVQSEKIDARLSGWKKIKESCQNILCDPPNYGGSLKPWINKVLAEMGKSMNSQALDTFTARVELDYASTYNELQKLSLLTYTKKTISESDVIRSIGSSRVGTMIDFYRALGARQTKKCLDLVSRMLASEWASLQVFFQICKFYGIIIQILLLKKHNVSAAEITKNHLREVFQSQRQEFVKFSENYKLSQVWNIYTILLDTDAKIKLSQGSDALLLTQCLIKVMEVQ